MISQAIHFGSKFIHLPQKAVRLCGNRLKYYNINVIKLLKLSGIYWDDEIKNIAPNEYCGLNIVLTGTFSTMSREIVKAKLEVLGANITGSVGKSTNLVIAGPGAGSKSTNALKLGIRIINESELIESLKDLTFHHF